jgi:hypothetical protein
MTATGAWRAIFAVLLAFVTVMTLTPDPDDARSGLALARWIAEWLFHDAALTDKVAHFFAYAALGASATFGRLRVYDRRGGVIAALAAYGAALEFAQGIGGVRAAEIADAATNFAGALAAFPLALLAERIAAQPGRA